MKKTILIFSTMALCGVFLLDKTAKAVGEVATLEQFEAPIMEQKRPSTSSVGNYGVSPIADQFVYLTETYFPDPGFLATIQANLRQVLTGSFNLPEVESWLTEEKVAGIEAVSMAELATIPTIFADYTVSEPVKDLSGIQFFTNLKSLLMNDQEIEVLDLSHNEQLETLLLDNNKLHTVDLGPNSHLKTIHLSHNQLAGSLDLSLYKQLEIVGIMNNQLTNLNLGNLTRLHSLSAQANQLTSIDTSQLPSLEILFLSRNLDLSELRLSGNPNLKTLYLDDSGLRTLDLSQNTLLETLNINRTELTSLNLNSQGVLRELHARQLPALKELLYSGSSLETFYIEQNALAYLELDHLDPAVVATGVARNQTVETVLRKSDRWYFSVSDLMPPDRTARIRIPDFFSEQWEMIDDAIYYQIPDQPQSFTYEYLVSDALNIWMPVHVNLSAYQRRVTFDLKGGSGNLENLLLYPGEPISVPETPEKEGFDFAGWFFKGRLWNFDLDRMPDENVELVAHWQPQEVVEETETSSDASTSTSSSLETELTTTDTSTLATSDSELESHTEETSYHINEEISGSFPSLDLAEETTESIPNWISSTDNIDTNRYEAEEQTVNLSEASLINLHLKAENVTISKQELIIWKQQNILERRLLEHASARVENEDGKIIIDFLHPALRAFSILEPKIDDAH